MDNYSLSDLKSVVGDDGWNSSGAWLIILFVLLFGGGNFFNRNGELGQYATAASQQEILFGQQFQNLNASINKVGDGLASLGYSQLQQMDANTASINGNITAEGRGLQTQLSDCCCTTNRNIDSVRFDMSNYHADTNAIITAQTQKVLDALAQNKIETLQGQINQLQLQNAMNGVVRYPNGWTYNAGVSPFCGGNSCCGCN